MRRKTTDQIMAKFTNTSFFIHVCRLSLPKLRFKRSALEMRKVKIFLELKGFQMGDLSGK